MLFSSLSKDQICILLCSSKIYSLKRQIKGLWIRGYEAHLGAEYQPDKKWRLNECMHTDCLISPLSPSECWEPGVYLPGRRLSWLWGIWPAQKKISEHVNKMVSLLKWPSQVILQWDPYFRSPTPVLRVPVNIAISHFYIWADNQGLFDFWGKPLMWYTPK